MEATYFLEIPIIQRERAKKFYGSVFQVEIKEEEHMLSFVLHPMEVLLSVETKGVLPYVQKTGTPGYGILPYLPVEGRMEAALKAVTVCKGVVICNVHDMRDMKRAIVCDTEGNVIALIDHL